MHIVYSSTYLLKSLERDAYKIISITIFFYSRLYKRPINRTVSSHVQYKKIIIHNLNYFGTMRIKKYINYKSIITKEKLNYTYYLYLLNLHSHRRCSCCGDGGRPCSKGHHPTILGSGSTASHIISFLDTPAEEEADERRAAYFSGDLHISNGRLELVR